MKVKTKIRLLTILIFILATVISGQENYQHILKAYPDWETNFDKKSIELDELMSGGPPKDGIPALSMPEFVGIERASEWLNDKEPVVSVEINGEAKSYPLQILMYHELVNDKIGGIPVLVTFCPLCYSSLVYDRRVEGKTKFFGVSGLLRNSNMVMYDQRTHSFWQELTGEAIVGDFTGTKLDVFPSQIISFKQFADAYPNGTVLSRETGHDRNYGSNPYAGYDDADENPFLYKGELDDRVQPKEKLIVIKGEDPKAYTYSFSSKKKVINDTNGNKSYVVFHVGGAVSALDKRNIAKSKESGSTGVFSRSFNGKELTFVYKDGKIMDEQTNSVWDITGKAVSGKLKGSELKGIPHGDYFAFAWLSFKPETKIIKN
jgi:hypothetical protein